MSLRLEKDVSDSWKTAKTPRGRKRWLYFPTGNFEFYILCEGEEINNKLKGLVPGF